MVWQILCWVVFVFGAMAILAVVLGGVNEAWNRWDEKRARARQRDAGESPPPCTPTT